MSNFNFDSFKGYEGRIVAGPEVINGTGEVSLKFFENADQDSGNMVFFRMGADEVLELARWLADKAWEAKRQKWCEENLLSG